MIFVDLFYVKKTPDIFIKNRRQNTEYSRQNKEFNHGWNLSAILMAD